MRMSPTECYIEYCVGTMCRVMSGWFDTSCIRKAAKANKTSGVGPEMLPLSIFEIGLRQKWHTATSPDHASTSLPHIGARLHESAAYATRTSMPSRRFSGTIEGYASQHILSQAE